MTRFSRRGVLRAAGGLAVAGTVLVAGCSSSCPDSDHPTPDVIRSIDAETAGAFATTPTGTWPTSHGDAGNTGYAGSGATFDDVALQWRTALSMPAGDGAERSASAPVVGDDRVFVADSERVHALDLRTGNVAWRSEPVSPTTVDSWDEYRPTTATPTIGPEGNVYVGNVGGAVALDPDGSVRWRSDAVTSATPPTIVDGTIYAAGNDRVLALDADDGGLRWTSSFSRDEVFSPLAVGDGVVVGTGNRTAVGFDAATGDRRWHVDGTESRPVIAGDTCYVGTEDALVAVSIASGEERWRFGRGDYRPMRSPVITPDTIYLVEHPPEAGSATFALDRRDGPPKPRWCSDVGSGAVTAAADERAFALLPIGDGPAGRPAVVGFTADLGAVPWAVRGGRVGRGAILPPAVLEDAMVVTTRDGTVAAFGERTTTNGGD